MARDWNSQGVDQTYDELTEVYEIKPRIWKAAGMEPMGGCLCIGCLEKRIGRMLTARTSCAMIRSIGCQERSGCRHDGSEGLKWLWVEFY